jgi:hypothetical protein
MRIAPSSRGGERVTSHALGSCAPQCWHAQVLSRQQTDVVLMPTWRLHAVDSTCMTGR